MRAAAVGAAPVPKQAPGLRMACMQTGKYDSESAASELTPESGGQKAAFQSPAGDPDSGLRRLRLCELEKLVQSGAYHVDGRRLIEALLEKEPALFRPARSAGPQNSSDRSRR